MFGPFYIFDRPFKFDPLDVEYDGVTLRVLLKHDERARQDRHGDHPNLATPAQRAALSAHWSAELRAKVNHGVKP